LYKFARRLGVSEIKAFGLDTSNVIVEKVPLMIDKSYKRIIKKRDSMQNHLMPEN
jgi:hypothetical protein